MGHNVDLSWLLGLPKYMRCPRCKEMTRTDFDDYDIDCGEPQAKDGLMSLDVYCAHCDHEFAGIVQIVLPFMEKKKIEVDDNIGMDVVMG